MAGPANASIVALVFVWTSGELLTAGWLVPVASLSVRNGAVAIRDGCIGWLGCAADLPQAFAGFVADCVPGVLMPGLVNAHTHPQYTDFDALGRNTCRDFDHWAGAFEVTYVAVTDAEDWKRAAERGVRLALQTERASSQRSSPTMSPVACFAPAAPGDRIS